MKYFNWRAIGVDDRIDLEANHCSLYKQRFVGYMVYLYYLKDPNVWALSIKNEQNQFVHTGIMKEAAMTGINNWFKENVPHLLEEDPLTEIEFEGKHYDAIEFRNRLAELTPVKKES